MIRVPAGADSCEQLLWRLLFLKYLLVAEVRAFGGRLFVEIVNISTDVV